MPSISTTLPLDQSLPVGSVDKRSSGFWAMVFLIFTEGALFAYLLFSYYYLAAQPHQPGMFPEGGAPSMKLSLPDTIILLTSSGTVLWAQKGLKRGNKLQLVLWLGVSAVLGMIFLVIQGFEWYDKPFGLASSPYSSLYFTVTGFHMAHVAVGVLVLWGLFLWALLGYFDRVRNAYLHTGALYWHFVDAVWLFIFFTFYITPLLGLRT